MAQFTPCFLPKFGGTCHGPKRPVAIRTGAAPTLNLQLLSALNRGRLASLLQTTWALVLRCYTNSEDICFGYRHVEVDRPQQCSDHENMSAIRLAIGDGDSVKVVVGKMEDNAAIGNPSETYDPGYRLFNTTLMLRSYGNSMNNLPSPGTQPVLTIALPDECRIRLHVKVLQGEIAIFLEWWNHDMSMKHIESLAAVFENVLTWVLSDDDISVSDLDHFTDKDWQRICKWNSSLPENHERCIHEVIHEQSLLQPEKEAVCAWDGSLTYSELDRLASTLACYLQTHGVGPEVRVGLCFDKSKWNTVAMLGVLKAGGAFVPLDPAHPADRLRNLMTAIQARIMVCSSDHVGRLSSVAETLLPLSDGTLDSVSTYCRSTSPLHEVASHNAAYVLFTSGSTGEPKGVLVEHRAFCSSATAHAGPFHIDSNARALQFAAHTFDASLVDILTPLMHGGCVCVPSESARLNDIVTFINDMKVNHVCLTPSFIGFIDPSSVPGVETVILAGEAMSPSHIATWSDRYLVNGYGPTESSVAATINPGMTPYSDCRDIGFAAGIRPWIVDPEDHNQLVPVGCAGELLLEGPTLARGYVNNQWKTDEVFIYDPIWSKSATSDTRRRFYKTGDLVRYSSDDCCLAYIGRKDTQVKLHGQRIELGEIENHLSADAKVKHCSVLYPNSGFSKGKIVAVVSLSNRHDGPGELGLVPFKLVDQQTKAGFVTEARQRLSTRLPQHMIPTVWLCVEALLFLTSGKLDRKSVASWVGSMENDPGLQVAETHSSREDFVIQPVSEVEEQLLSTWSRILDIPVNRISPNDSFLGLGGDSIAAITCTSSCKKSGIGLTVQDILHSKSLREVARRAKTVKNAAVYQETVEEPFDLSPIQKLHFLLRKEGQGHFNQSILTRMHKKVEVEHLRHAIETLVTRHSMLRARFTDSSTESAVCQRITQDIPGSFHCGIHNVKESEDVKQAISESQGRMNSISGPVLAVDLFNPDEQNPLLFMVAHHLVVDIVSWRIILEDLEELLMNPDQSAPQNSSLPFQTWCRLQADRCETDKTERLLGEESLPDPDLAYWGMERTPILYGNAACVTFELDSENTSLILRDCHECLRTEPVDIFLATLLHSFAQTFQNRTSPVIYNEGHGREVWDSTIDISRTVGWFTTLSPIFISELDLNNPRASVSRVKDLRRRASDNGREDFARRMLPASGKKCSQHYPMEISFNYVGQHRDLQRQDGLFQLTEQMAGEASQGGGSADFGEATPRFALFETSAMVVEGRLRFNFSFNRFMRHQNSIRDWITRCRDLLTSTGEQLRSLTPQPTLSDFPMLSLTYESLETMKSQKLPRAGIESLELIEDIYPCSRLQQSVILNHLRDASLYMVHATFEVRGIGNSQPTFDRLKLAWQKVVSHHAMLRTVFVENLTERDLFSQVVLKNFDAAPVYLQCANDDHVLQTLDKLPPMNHHQHKPVHRLSVCQTGTGKLFCRLELSHAVMDGVSISILLRDLQLAYSEALDQTRKPLFKGFMQCLQDSPKQAAVDYWCSYLENIKPCNFPVLNDGRDSPRHLQCLRLDFDLFKELRKFSEASGITLSTAFNVAWGLTLSAYCGSDEVCFGYMVSLRDLPVEEVKSVVGPAINLIACRMKLSGNSMISDVLEQTQNDYMESLSYRHSSLIDIQHALKLSDTTLFNSGVSYQKLPPPSEKSNADIEFVEACSIHDPAEFPVFVNVEVTENDAQVELNYWTTTLSDGQAENLASTFLQSLKNIALHEHAEICQLDSLSDRNKEQLRVWNSNLPEDVDECIPEIFDHWAKSRPDAAAITTCDGDLTYSELNELSSRLAAYLTTLGVDTGAHVPMDLDKSMWAGVSIMAVFKLGGVCIPLNGYHSQTYLDKWFSHNEVQVCLVSPTRAKLFEATVPYVVTIDSRLLECLPATEGQGCASDTASAAGYVVFAADDSGEPQCIELDHRAVRARAKNFAEHLQIHPDVRLLQYSACTSDLFLQEMFGALLHGGCVCLAPDGSQVRDSALAKHFQANFLSVPSSTGDCVNLSDIPEVRGIALSGGRSTRKFESIWATKLQLHTLSGTPECSSTCISISDNGVSDDLQNFRPTAGCISWVVDHLNHNRLVPIGCIGELVIEGPMLAHGYFDENIQSGSNFIEDPEWILTLRHEISSSNGELNPVAATPNRRMFKTGSLVRYNSDGSLAYVGNKSDETKRRSLFDVSCSSEADITYWKEYLADIEPCLFPSLWNGSTNGEMCTETLNLKHAAELRAFSRAAGVPSSFVLQIAWGLVLRCYTGLEDVCFAYSASQQALLCRLSLRDNISIEKALEISKVDFDRGMAHQVSLADVQEAFGIEDGMSGINTVLNCCEKPRLDKGNSTFAGPNSTRIHNWSKYRIAIDAEICHGSVNICFGYSPDSLSSGQITDVIDCFEHIVDSIIQTKPGSVIGDLDFFTQRTCQRVREWNATLPERFEKCAHEIIKHQTLALPSSTPAVCAWNGDFTYSQLEIMSSRLAHKLTELGVEPETFVALCFEKSAWAVVAQLAVLKAGGAFASLDPSHPDARLKALAGDIRAHVILCSRRHHDRASKICDFALVIDENIMNGLPNPPPNTPLIRPTPDNAAYGIFTSGTTGKPKLTVVEHIALATASVGLARTLNMDSKSRALQFSNYTFDVSVLETILTLMTGGCICIPSDDERMNDLSGAIRRMGANFISVPPGITNTLEPKNVPSLTTIITGGEKITPNHIERWSDRCVINAYGPSESTIVATASVKIDRQRNHVNDDSNSIGVALCGRTWVVDPHNHHRLVPVGAVGELVLEGSNVARGYLNNEQKTSEVFVQDPEWTRYTGLQDVLRRKERMYRTGDLVRYNPDGSLTFISRRDTQIKFNGQRIELEEIESQCIRYLPEGTQLAVDVVVPKSKAASKGLAVFFTVNARMLQDIASQDLLIHMSKYIRDILKELQASLTETLPLNMIPKYFFPVRHLPFTTAGKLDRKGLLEMAQSLQKDELRAYILSSSVDSKEVTASGMEGTLRSLWEKVLDLTPGSVSMEDSFFGLGGDSYSAMSLVGAAQSHGISLSVADIFKYPLFTDMAQSCGVSTQAHQTDLTPFSILPDSVKLDDVLEEVADQCRVAKHSIADVYPCSAVQEGLLTLSIKQRGAYIAQPFFRLADSVDIGRFKAAWQKTVDQLDILRTRIAHTETSNFLQVVLREAPISWASVNALDQLPGDTLDLPKHNGGLLTSYAIVKSDCLSGRYFIWTAHHALYDGWTVPLILRRVEENYSGSLPGKPTVPYGLFIDYLSKRDMSKSDQFWMSYLSNLSSTPFPQNKNPLPNAARAGNSHQNTMDIYNNSTNTGLTLPVLIRAAWAIVVSAHTGSGDVCFGETLMGRNIDLLGISEIAGPALTTVPTRVQVDNGLTIPQYLQNMHQVTAEMIPHQHSGLQRIRKLGNDAALACEFQNLLVIQSDGDQLSEEIWSAENNQASEEFFTHPLVIECKVSESKIQTTVHHDEIVVESWMAQKLIDQFSFVLTQLLETPKGEARRLSELNVFSPQDMEQVAQWNSRELMTVDKCIHDLVLERCSLHPHAIAVCGWDGQLSYQELCTASASFARYLTSRGIGPEVIVPICLDKTIWVPVTILSILMAGGGFLPMDPTHPPSRHEEILAELDVRVLLCSPHYCNRYSSAVKTVIPINKDTIKAYGALNQHARMPNNITASNMAYTLFTSGSSGRPKGIVTQHRAIVSSVMAFSPVIQLNSTSRVFQFASLTFDAAMLELFATLLFGGCICIPSETERLNDVAGAIRRMNVSWTFLTPAIASIIEPSSTPSLKVITCGGEAVPPEVVTKWINAVNLFIGYGPTETTIFAAVNAELSSNRDPACIGHGIPCTLTWVVDSENHSRLAPLGAVGELVLEGPALAREYLRNPEKTAESFVDEPEWAAAFSPAGSCRRRIYKTGDLVRYNSDGSLEYLGRKDHQVKLHGLRMELGEIEFRLKENPRVRHAVVVLPKSGLLQKRLVTVLSLRSLSSEVDVVSDGACELVQEDHLITSVYPEIVEIQKSLESQLPIYMVPQTWAVIKKIPMLVSDKTDRKTITNWLENVDESVYDRIMQDYDKIKQTKSQESAKEDEEAGVKVLQNILAHVLNLPSHKINAGRSFVSLGGDSITGMAVVSRARKHGFSLTLHDVLQSKSLEELVAVAGSSVRASEHQEATGEYFGLSPIQRLYLQSPNVTKPNARFNQGMTLRVSRRVEPGAVKQAVKAVVSQHSMLRARFNVSRAGEWQQRLTNEIDSSFRLRIHSVNDEQETISKIGQSQRCLDIQNGPILAADLFDVRGNDQILFLVASHLCVDMVSWRIILQDIQECIDSGSLVPEKPLSFKAWCEMQMEHSRESKNSSQLPFTVQQPNLEYWGMEGVSNVYGDIKIERFTLDEQTTDFIFGKCNEALRTEVADILLSAVIHSFRRVFTDRSIPNLYNEGHGRESWDSDIDPSRTVGWFTTLCPLGIEVDSDNILETVKRVKDTRRKIPGSGRPHFAQGLLHPNSNSRSKDFDVPLEILFNYLGRLQQLERGDSLFQPHGDVFSDKYFDSTGDMGHQTSRFALFEVSSIMIKEKLHVSFTYNRNMRRERQIHQWISECKRVLEEGTALLKNALPEFTLSDYPLLPITYDGLKSLTRDTLPRAGITSKDQVEDIYPCSPMQEGILLSQLRDPNSYMFHVIFEVKDPEAGRVDSKRLEEAWQKVVGRHSILRTIFIDSNYKGGSFDQLVLGEVYDNVLDFECDDSDALDRLESVKLREMNDRRMPKTAHQLAICKTFTERVLIKLEISHAIIDGGSVDILLRDFALAYNQQLPKGQGPRYSCYIEYIRARMQDQDLAHWKQYMNGVNPCHLSFANDPAPNRQLKSIKMDFDRFPELQRFCETQSVTLANLTLAAWAIVLRRFTEADDVCFGYPSAGRDAPVPGMQEAVGIFINMLCCRVRFAPGQTLTDISRMVQDDYISSLPHQSCSLASIQHELGLEGQALFNTTLSIQNHSKPGDSKGSLLTFDLQKAYDPSEYPVTVNVETARGREGILLRYWTDALSETQAKGLADAIAQVFTRFIEKPSEPISEMDVHGKALQVNALRSRRVSQATVDHMDSTSLKRLIDDRVNEVISHMFKEGKLAIPSLQSETGSVPNSVVRDDRRSISADNKSVEVKKPTSTHTAAEEKEKPTELERKLWNLWSSALDLPSSIVRLRDSFFKLGGDSITAMKMASAAREQGLTLTVADVFNNPVFEDMLASVLATAMPHPTDDECLSQKAGGRPTENIILEESISSRNASMMAPTYVDSTALQSGICPKIGVFKGGIADVLPVTDFQALSITATLFKSRWMLNYFYLDGKGPLDLRRLREGCMRVVDSFDILRTVFVSMRGQFFQVVLRKVRPSIFVYETEKALDEFTESLQQKDRDHQPRQGEQYVQFFVVKKKGSNHHRILIRLSHTQFDGVCLPRIFSALKTAYEGSPLPPTSPFANYMRLLPGTITPEHYQHWTALLKGSKMPIIVQREGQNTFQQVGSFTEIKRTVDVPSAALGNITMATVMQAAWAMTLAKVCAESDVVFGLTINGRNTTMPSVESTVGPCLNVIPVRVNFGERWTGLDLFRYLQDQQVANMPYESLGFREIIRHCTDWPDSTFFTTSVFHQNVDYEGQIQLDNNTYRIGGAGVLDSLSDLTVASKQSSPRNLDITLGYSHKSAIPASFAAKALDMLCETVECLSANPNAVLPSASTLRSLPTQSMPTHPVSPDESSLSSHLRTRNIADLLVHSDLLAKAWKQVLPASATNQTSPAPDPRTHSHTQPPFHLDTSFFDLGGDVFAMAQLSWILLDQEGLHIHLEDLLSHPTFLGQMSVLALHYRSSEGCGSADGDKAGVYGDSAGADATVNGTGSGKNAKEGGTPQSEDGKMQMGPANRRAWGKTVASLARRVTRRRLDF